MPFFDPDTKLVFLSGKVNTPIPCHMHVCIYVSFWYPGRHKCHSLWVCAKREPIPFWSNPIQLRFISPGENFPYYTVYLLYMHILTQTARVQAIGVLPKVLCDAKNVEVLKGVRLTKSTIEQFTIRVPRTRLEYFQDDIYPATLVHWESALTVEEWLGGKNNIQRTVSMHPTGMKPCKLSRWQLRHTFILLFIPRQWVRHLKLLLLPRSFPAIIQILKQISRRRKRLGRVHTNLLVFYSWSDLSLQLLSAMIDRMGEKEEDPLPQTTMDGCDSDEWSD